MATRYSDRANLTGKLNSQLRKIITDLLDSSAALQTFVREKIGRDTVNSINWNQAIAYASSEVISHCQSRGKTALLIEQLLDLKADSKDLEELVVYLVDAGYLNDSEKPDVPTTNPRNRDWMADFPFDRVSFAGADRSALIQQIAACFTSPAAVERFLGDNFKSDLGKQLRHGIDRTQSVATVIDRLVNELARINWLNCFVMAVQGNNLDVFELGMTAMAIHLAYNPPKPKPVTPTGSTVAAASTKPASPTVVKPAPAPEKAFRVVRATGKLTPELHREIVELLLGAFQNNDLGRLVHYNLNVRLDHIVSSGPFGKVCEDLLRWCEEQQNGLAPLFNAILKERPHRTDVKPLLEKLAAANIIEIEK